jgi:hypothetical protein
MSHAPVQPSVVMLDGGPRLSKYLLAGYCDSCCP